MLGAQLLAGALFGIMGLILADPMVAMIKTALEQKSDDDEAEAEAEARDRGESGGGGRRRGPGGAAAAQAPLPVPAQARDLSASRRMDPARDTSFQRKLESHFFEFGRKRDSSFRWNDEHSGRTRDGLRLSSFRSLAPAGRRGPAGGGGGGPAGRIGPGGTALLLELLELLLLLHHLLHPLHLQGGGLAGADLHVADLEHQCIGRGERRARRIGP